MMMNHGRDKFVHRKAELEVNRSKFKKPCYKKALIEDRLLSFFRIFFALRTLLACSFQNSGHAINISTAPSKI